VYLQPPVSAFPAKGGVKQHLEQIYRRMIKDTDIAIVSDPNVADILHVESAYPIPETRRKKPVVYVCHGGFLPQELEVVRTNLIQADIIVSVAEWVANDFFAEYAAKTVVIPNGVDLSEFENLRKFDNKKDYIMYGKEYEWNFSDFQTFILMNPDKLFISTYWPAQDPIPGNVQKIGLQSPAVIKQFLHNASALIMTGSEVCPVMTLEAWAAGTPVIAKDLHGNAELMRPDGKTTVGGSLYFVPSAEVVNGVLQRRDELGQQGRSIVEERYQWVNLWKQYREVYDRL